MYDLSLEEGFLLLLLSLFILLCSTPKKYKIVARALYSDDIFSCSANRGDSLDRSIDSENRQNDDFVILVCH